METGRGERSFKKPSKHFSYSNIKIQVTYINGIRG